MPRLSRDVEAYQLENQLDIGDYDVRALLIRPRETEEENEEENGKRERERERERSSREPFSYPKASVIDPHIKYTRCHKCLNT
ncbi:hypothetical protein ALC62_13239 [Cyphomyrmex costatus]|uniref:Uncharacterized protein n=1 Tax=Cyphomyrmex costatus TaxID=456900 RepID=A0A195C5R6_9HYME|nr:hypothetical protein ALC62_13239 [Cyphomyrmex costatus]